MILGVPILKHFRVLLVLIRYQEIFAWNDIQSTLVISKSKGPTKTLRDIRTSTYQICSIEEKTIGTTNCHK